MACRLIGAKPLSELMLPYCQLDPAEYITLKLCLNSNVIIHRNALENVLSEMVAILSQCVDVASLLGSVVLAMHIALGIVK